MKKGYIPLLFSFVMGCVYVVMYYLETPASFEMRRFGFFTREYSLPYAVIPGYMILITLGLIFNFCAMISGASSVAIGAAVFFGVSIAARPEVYPFSLVQCLLCMIAAARMSVNRNEEIGESRDLSNQIRRSGGSAAAAKQSAAAKAQRRSSAASQAQGSSVDYQVQRGSGAAYQSRSLEEVQRELEGRNSLKASRYQYQSQSAEEVQRALEGKGPSKSGSAVKVVVFITIIVVTVTVCIIVSTMMRKNKGKQADKDTVSWRTSLEDLNEYVRNMDSHSGGTTDSGKNSTTGGGTTDSGKNSTTGGGTTDDGKNSTTGGTTDSGTSAEDAAPIDLTGHWSTGAGASATHMEADIEEDSISVYWIMNDGKESLYWKGSFTPMDVYSDPYTWMSIMDARALVNQPFSSKEGSKFFIYKNESIVFSANLSGIELKIRLYRSEKPDKEATK